MIGADVAIGEGKSTQPRPPRPSIKPKPTVPSGGTDEVTVEPAPGTSDEAQTGPQYVGLTMALVSLFLVLCGFAALYIYHYHGKRFKLFMRWNQNKKSTGAAPELPPVPPPRSRRPPSSSILIGSPDSNTDSTS